MQFKEKYCSEIEKTKEENKDKIALSNDAYAISEMIDLLIKQIEITRISMKK
jgi:hypothetical protein